MGYALKGLKGICCGAAACCAVALCGQAQAGLFDFFQDSSVDTVKNSVLDEYSEEITVGSALDNYYDCQKGSGKWDSLTGPKDLDLVQFTCSLTRHPGELKDQKIMQVAGMLMGNLQGFLDLFDQSSKDKDRQSTDELSKQSMDFAKLDLRVQFAMSKKDSSSFRLYYVGLDGTYQDGLKGQIGLPDGTLHAIYDDEDLWNYVIDHTDDGLSGLVTTLLQARTEAVENSSSSKGEII